MDGYPHLSLQAENAQDRAWLTTFMNTIAAHDELTAFYWAILMADLSGCEHKEMTLGMYRDYFIDGEHNMANVTGISFNTICAQFDEHITPEIRDSMAKLMQKTATMLLE